MKKISISNFLKQTPTVPQYSEKNQNYLISGANPISYLETGVQEEQSAPLAASVDWAQFTVNPPNAGVDIYTGVGGLGTSGAYGQSFVGLGQTLSTIKVFLKKTGSPNDTIYAEVFASTGSTGSYKPTGSFIALSGGVSASSLTGSYALTTFTFTGANAITLTTGTVYIIVVNYRPYGDFSNYITSGTSTGLSGNASYSNDSTNWTIDSTQDLILYVNSPLLSTQIEGNVIHEVASTEGTYSIYLITDTTAVYGIATTNGVPTSIASLGYPGGGGALSGKVNGYLAIGGGDASHTSGYLFATYGGTQSVYYMPLPSGSWTATGSILQASRHILEPFLDFIAIEDSSMTGTYPSLVKKLSTTAFTVSTGIDLGTGFGVLKYQNFNDKYLAIAGGKVASGITGFVQNYIFLWDGISSRYNYAMRIPGQFIDMKVIDSILYVAVKVSSGKTCLYYMTGTALKKVMTSQISAINSSIIRSQNLCSIFNFKNYIGLNLVSNSDLNYPILIHGQDEMGNIEFIYSSGRQFDQFVIGYDGTIFTNTVVAGSNSILYYLPVTGTYQNILYKSQWIPIQNLQAIDVYYDSPPTGSDEIDVTIYGRGEDIISGNSTTVLTPITSSTILNTSRTRLDCKGFTGDKVKVVLSTNFTLTQPIIRAIDLITL